jgi:hypothetical protein
MTKLNVFMLFLLFVSFVLGGKVITLPDLKKPENIIVDQNQILITEFPHIYIYSLKDFKLIKKFGKAGEGPQEFFNYVRIQPHPDYPDYIVVGSHMRMSYFTRKGEFVKEIRSKTSTRANVYKPLGKNYAAYGLVQENRIAYSTVELYDSNLKKIKEVIRWERTIQQGKSINPTGRDFLGGEFRIYDKKIFVLLRDTGNVEVFDDNGSKLFPVNYDYERIPVTSDDKRRLNKFYKTRLPEFYQEVSHWFKYPSYYPSGRILTVADDKIYVLTHKTKERKSEFVVFDMKGKFLKKLMIPFKDENAREPYPFTINYGNFFQLIDNLDTEQWEFHIHPIQ